MNVTTPEQFYTKKDYEFLKNNFLQNYHHFFFASQYTRVKHENATDIGT